VRRAGDRVLGDAALGREEPGDEVELRVGRARGDDDAAGGDPGNGREVRVELPHRFVGFQLHKEIELAPLDVHRAGAERALEVGRRLARGRRRGGEVERNPAVAVLGGEHAAPGVEPGDGAGRQPAGLPEPMRARDGRVAAEVDLNGEGEPAEVVVGGAWRARCVGGAGLAARTRKPVSARFISRAAACIQASSRGLVRRQTPAGLPANGAFVNASIWAMGRGMGAR
jgi:hypothetical protein